ncbi:MAG TPA: HAD-IA family hydrolase [Streptosporangiaceae bacterium]
MESPEAFLIDVYDTMITCDFTVFNLEMGRLAGVSAEAWRAGYEASVGSGVVTIAGRMAEILAHCGLAADPSLVARLAARDGELLRENCRLYDDVLPFLRLLRARGVKVAVVSNCDEHTPGMLAAAGVPALADALSYSCEVGHLKPSPVIYEHALDQLGVAPGAAVFVDDQPAFCAAANGLGMAAIQIARGEAVGPPPPGVPLVSSFREIEELYFPDQPGTPPAG